MWKEQIHHSKGRIHICIEEPKLKSKENLLAEFRNCGIIRLHPIKRVVGRILSVVCEECANFERWCSPSLGSHNMRGKVLKENYYIIVNFNYSHTSSSKDKQKSSYTGMLTTKLNSMV
jgi:hypothetical protein